MSSMNASLECEKHRRVGRTSDINVVHCCTLYYRDSKVYFVLDIISESFALFFCSAAKNAVKGKVATSFLAVGHVSHMYGFYGKVITDRF